MILFPESGAVLDAPANAVITSAAQQIRQAGDLTVNVIGYTDANGNSGANQQLSLERANAVVAVLQQELTGLNVQFHASAQGQAQPVASNDTPQGQQLNRRVSIQAQR